MTSLESGKAIRTLFTELVTFYFVACLEFILHRTKITQILKFT